MPNLYCCVVSGLPGSSGSGREFSNRGSSLKTSAQTSARSMIVTLKSIVLPSRSTVSETDVPMGVSATRATRSSPSFTGVPFMAVMISSTLIPALSAGPSFLTTLTSTPGFEPSARNSSGLLSAFCHCTPMEPRVTRPVRITSL